MLIKAHDGGNVRQRRASRSAALHCRAPGTQTLVFAQPELWAGAAENRGCAEIFLLELHSFVASISPDLLVLILIASKKL